MKLKLLIGLVITLGLAACSSNSMYYWGNYESSLYRYNQSPDTDNLTRHKNELQNVIDNAERYEKRIPPGIQFELALIELKKGNTTRAKTLFIEEKAQFPEAQYYVDRMLLQLEGTP